MLTFFFGLFVDSDYSQQVFLLFCSRPMRTVYSLCRRELNMTIKDLFKSRLCTRALEAEVQKPKNVHRWRTLEVRIRDTDWNLRLTWGRTFIPIPSDIFR